MTTVIDLWTVQIIDTGGPYEHASHWRAKTVTPEMMAETEENLTDLLPPGYRARIRRWNDPDPTQEDDDE